MTESAELTTAGASSIDEISKEMGRLVRRCRAARDMTQEQVAAETGTERWGSPPSGVGSKSVMLLEGGRTDMMLDDLLKVLFAVGLDLKPAGARAVPDAERVEVRIVECREALEAARSGKNPPSLLAISNASGVEQGQIGAIIRGDVLPRFRTYFALCRALDIDVEIGPTAGRRSLLPRETVDMEDLIARGSRTLRAHMRSKGKTKKVRAAA